MQANMLSERQMAQQLAELKSHSTIAIVDDDSSIRWVLERALSSAGFACQSFDCAAAILNAIEQGSCQPAVVLSDIRMPGMDGLNLLQQLQAHLPDLPVIIMTAHSDLDAAVSAYQHGAFDYIPKPFDIDEVITLVEHALLQNQPQSQANSATATEHNSTGLIGEAPAMQAVFRVIGRLSKSSITVLINGESGTGKELVAQALHQHSPRSGAPFIALNMAAIPKDLIEAELFGYEKGAFTGANQLRYGRFEQANGGTLFLDEIGDMPLEVQTRLLRVLADGQFYRIGGYTPIKVDVRIIAATHQNLEQRVQQGQFREDLFHRLNVIRIMLPPLRERAEDIPRLANYFLQQMAQELGVECKVMSAEAMQKLQQYHWSGNVRELENLCRRLTVMASGKEILPADLPPEFLQTTVAPTQSTVALSPSSSSTDWPQALQQWADQAFAKGETALLDHVIDQVEQILLHSALKQTHGHKQAAAQLLGWGRNTLTRKLKGLKSQS